MTKYLIFLIITLSIFGCKPKEIETSRIELPTKYLALLPYKDNQKISLLHTNGHEVVFDVYRHNDWGKSFFLNYDCIRCDRNYVSYQSDTTILTANYPKMQMKFIMNSEFSPSYYATNYIYITFNNNLTAFSYFDTTIIDYSKDTSDVFTTFFDTLQIDNREFYNVVECSFQNYFQDSTIENYPKSIFINKQYGLIQIKLTEDEAFTLK